MDWPTYEDLMPVDWNMNPAINQARMGDTVGAPNVVLPEQPAEVPTKVWEGDYS